MSARLVLALALAAAPAFAQDDEDPLDRYLRLAQTGSPVVRPQAAERFAALGAPAAERVLAEAESPEGLAGLGRELIEVLGRLDDERLRARLWSALENPDFPWRPAAARSLASTVQADERERFTALLADPLAAVRAAAVGGFDAPDALSSEVAISAVRARLEDPDDRVRRVAADLLDRHGHHDALAWLLEDLEREDHWFEVPSGKLARYEVLRLLGDRLGGRHGYDPEKPADAPENSAALAALRRAATERAQAELPEVPAIARAVGGRGDEVLGLEIRSCRRGEYFLRWTAGDELWVGRGNPARVSLPEGSTARLLELTKSEIEPLADRRAWGQPGCDVEILYVRPPDARRARSLQVSKGPEAVADLRPEALATIFTELLETLPPAAADGDPRLANLRDRVTAALAAVGGPLAP